MYHASTCNIQMMGEGMVAVMRLEYLLTKKRPNDFCHTEEQLKSLFQSNARVTIEGNTLTLGKKIFDCVIEKWDVDGSPKEMVFYVVVSSGGKDEDAVESLGEFDRFIRHLNTTCGDQFTINTIWDDVSMYYERELYPRIARVENLLRAIVYRFMIRATGDEWFDNTVPEGVKKSITETLKKNHQSLDETGEDQLYYADFIQLGRFIFDSYSLRPLSRQAFEDVRAAMREGNKEAEGLLDQYEPKSNWERYFEDAIQVDDLNDKWTKLYGYRNQVAHTKRMSQREFQDAMTLIDKLTVEFESCLERADAVKMSEQEAQVVKEVAKETVSPSRMVIRDANTGSVLSSSPSFFTMGDAQRLFAPSAGLYDIPRAEPLVMSARPDMYSLFSKDLTIRTAEPAFARCEPLYSNEVPMSSLLHQPYHASHLETQTPKTGLDDEPSSL